jgi:hypothetical protein
MFAMQRNAQLCFVVCTATTGPNPTGPGGISLAAAATSATLWIASGNVALQVTGRSIPAGHRIIVQRFVERYLWAVVFKGI